MEAISRKTMPWQLRTRRLELGRRTLVMGVVNVTPDSFSDGGAYLDPEAAVVRSMQLLDEGADILDLGAESTRPSSRAGGGAFDSPSVSTEEEQARVLPVLEGILKVRPNALVSVDTYKAATARAASCPSRGFRGNRGRTACPGWADRGPARSLPAARSAKNPG